MTCIFYVNKSNPVPKKTITIFLRRPNTLVGFSISCIWRDNPHATKYNIKGRHISHQHSYPVEVLELESNMYAAIVVFFASIVGVYSLSIHKRSCSVTIDSDFAVNKVRLIFCFFSPFFNVWKNDDCFPTYARIAASHTYQFW